MRAALLPILSRPLVSRTPASGADALKRSVLKPALVMPLLAAALISGCATSPAENARLDCAALKQVIATADTDLSGLSASRTNTAYGSVWRAKIAAYGSNCTLFGTADVPSQYFCSIPAAADSSVLVALQESVASCLGPDWRRNPASTRSGERLSREGSNIVVDVGASDAGASRAEVIGLLVRRSQH